MAALNRLGEAGRERSRARIVALTGSVGKTSTKEALKLALSAQGATYASPASFNNQWGVPLSLAGLPADADYAILEIGMNHAGEISPLARLIRPDIALVTTVEAVHLEYFDSLTAIADAKAEVFDGMGEGGIAVLNYDNPFHKRLATAARARGVCKIICFGVHPHATARLIGATPRDDGSTVEAEVGGAALRFEIGAPGRHWVTIAMATLATVHALGADVARAAQSLADVRPLPGRGAQHVIAVEGGAFTLIDESYNANPASVRAAIELLAAAPVGAGGRRIAVLGDMRELGEEGPPLHAALAEPLVRAGIDMVFTVGRNMAHLRDALPAAQRAGHAVDSDDMVTPVAAAIAAGDVVMVKGSLGTRMAPIVAGLHACKAKPAPRAAGNG
jgi:UDP-N-acetylmuramoyl-tripeptide--D-alanyl-D-alanine ligase